MRFALTFVGPDPQAVEAAAGRLPALLPSSAEVKARTRLGPGGEDVEIEADAAPPLREAARAAIAHAPVDVCVQPLAGRRKRLFLADMDSTIIGCEGLDELADYAGVKAQVSAVTERAMRGEIAFEGALLARVALLKGLPVEVLARCYAERVRLNPGARTLVRTLAVHGVRCELVSGGFDAFAAPVAEACGFHAYRANRLAVADGVFTGAVIPPILGRQAKFQALQSAGAALGIGLDAAMAVGDGANDLAMLGAAGLGIAYRAKPVVAEQADLRLDYADLSALLYVQGYSDGMFARDDAATR